MKYHDFNLTHWLLLLVVIILTSNALAQEKSKLNPNKKLSQYIYRNWNAQNGMPSDVSVNLFQSTDGYIWAATYNGIIRFDGANFSVYDLNSIEGLGKSSVQIQSLAQGSDGTIWFATLQGIVGYKNFNFFRDLNLNELNSTIVETLYFDSKTNSLWIGTNSNGLFRYRGNKLESFPDLQDITKAVVNCIISDENGVIWIGTEAGEIIRLKDGLFDIVTLNIRLGSIGGFYVNKTGKTWVATGKGIYYIESEKLFSFPELSGINATDIIEDSYGSLWIGSQNGMYRYSIEQKKVEVINEGNGFPSNLVRNIAFDREGNLWVATYRKGIVQISDGCVVNYSVDEGLSSNVITGIAQADSNRFYLGDEAGVINILENGRISVLKTKMAIPRDRLKHLLVDSNKTLWISTYGGLMRIDKHSNEKMFNFSTGFPSESIRLTFEDSKNNIWVGTRTDGLFRLNSNGEILQLYNQKNGLTSNYIMGLEEDAKGRIIVATKNGINFIEKNSISKHLSAKEGMPGNFAFNVYADSKNVLWITSNDGLIRVENDTTIFVFSITNGLFDNVVYDVLEDNDGFLWIPSNFGVVRISKMDLESFAAGKSNSFSQRIFGQSDGMKNSNCIGATKSLKASNGIMYFQTSAGVAVINPKTIVEEIEYNDILFENIVAESKRYYPSADGFKIPPGNKRFQVHFTALNFTSPDKLKFRFKLEPFDNDWVLAGNERLARYTNINPGKYKFTVNVSGVDGYWSTQHFTIPIEVEPLWHQTVWARLIISLIIAFFIWFIYKLRMHTIKLQREELENQVNLRTSLIAQQKVEMEHLAVEFEKLSIVARHTNNAILIADHNGDIIWINDAFIRLYGYTLDEYKASKGSSIIEASSNSDIAYVIDNCIQTKEPVSYTTQVETKLRGKTWIQTTLTPIPNEDGTIRNIVSIDTDITALKDAEAEMVSMSDEIITQNEAIMQQNDEIISQRDELEQVNKLLVTHTENIEASIRYAKTIQQAILPDKKAIDANFESFIVFKPRDIVSGDFYWFTKIIDPQTHLEKYFLAVVDCTGHGVPGAFMSMIGSRLLTEIISEQRTLSPAMVLVSLNRMVNQVLKQDVSESFDGMDVAICQIDLANPKEIQLTFSGANRPIYFLRKEKGEFETIRGSRKTIGGIMPDIDAEFAEHTLTFAPGDIVILNTDGFIDQNGNDNAKYSSARFQQLILECSHLPMEKIGEILDISFDEYRGTQYQRDDATMLGIRFR
jgi:PAS domain S-box-containing protein